MIDQTEAHPTNSVTLQKMMAEQVKLHIFDPPYHKLKTNTQNKLTKLQFMKDERSIRTTPLTSTMINTENLDYVSQKPYPIAMKNYQLVKEEIEKITCSKSHPQQQIKLVSSNHCST